MKGVGSIQREEWGIYREKVGNIQGEEWRISRERSGD